MTVFDFDNWLQKQKVAFHDHEKQMLEHPVAVKDHQKYFSLVTEELQRYWNVDLSGLKDLWASRLTFPSEMKKNIAEYLLVSMGRKEGVRKKKIIIDWLEDTLQSPEEDFLGFEIFTRISQNIFGNKPKMLYRGVSIRKKGQMGKRVVRSAPFSSWTTDIDVAREFGNVIIAKEFKPEEIFLMPAAFVSSIYEWQKEFIVKNNKKFMEVMIMEEN